MTWRHFHEIGNITMNLEIDKLIWKYFNQFRNINLALSVENLETSLSIKK